MGKKGCPLPDHKNHEPMDIVEMGKKGCPLPDHKNHEPMDIVEMDELYT